MDFYFVLSRIVRIATELNRDVAVAGPYQVFWSIPRAVAARSMIGKTIGVTRLHGPSLSRKSSGSELSALQSIRTFTNLINELGVLTGDRWMLIVEDDPNDERLARKVISLEKRRETVLVARDGEEALLILRAQDPPALVLLDLKLPRLSGVEVLVSIKEDPRLRVVPVVMLTSSDEKTDRMACYELGCNAFMRKPIDYDKYRSALKTMLDFWMDVNIGVC